MLNAGENYFWEKIEQFLATLMFSIRRKIYYMYFTTERYKPYIENLNDHDCSSYIFNKIYQDSLNCLSETLKHYSENFSPGYPIENIPAVPLIFEVLNFIEKCKLESKTGIKRFFLNKVPLKAFTWYLSTIITQKLGLIGVLQTSNIFFFLQGHPDFSHVKYLLKILDKEHWKKIEFGFLKSHLEEFQKDLYYPQHEFVNIFKENFLSLENPEETKFKLPAEYNIDMNEAHLMTVNFLKCAFVFHSMRYLKKYTKIKLDGLFEKKLSVFGVIFKIFQQFLRVKEAIEDENFVEIIQYPASDYFYLLWSLSYLKPQKKTNKSYHKNYQIISQSNLKIYTRRKSTRALNLWLKKVTKTMNEMDIGYKRYKEKWPKYKFEEHGDLDVWESNPKFVELISQIDETHDKLQEIFLEIQKKIIRFN
ncbi:hypothetical protein BY996DRAFT_1888212 [Phakopsora pachyrhizi]|nr:hypothetical protein BY996DRAFT_1888212 [Phakopsora pachyrhizi]